MKRAEEEERDKVSGTLPLPAMCSVKAHLKEVKHACGCLRGTITAEQAHSFSPAPTLSPTPALLLRRKSGT